MANRDVEPYAIKRENVPREENLGGIKAGRLAANAGHAPAHRRDDVALFPRRDDKTAPVADTNATRSGRPIVAGLAAILGASLSVFSGRLQ